MSRPELSIVIPAYNEERRLGPTLGRLDEWLEEREHLDAEILVVDDGSRDDTAELVRRAALRDPRIRLLVNPGNRGKGYSVRHGVLEARGGRVLFTDADLSTPVEEYERLRGALDAGADIAIGSRALPDSDVQIRQSIWRQTLGKTFNRVVQLVAVPGIRDTQCGFKLFEHDAARAVFERSRLDGFAFDVEALFIASRLGLDIAEIPVVWRNDEDTRVSPLRDGARMVRDLLRIRFLHRHLPRERR